MLDSKPIIASNPTHLSVREMIALARAGGQLPLKAMSIRAMQSGLYVSPFKGRGMEFDETRPYQAGDDIRTLDWKVTARTGKAHTKLFREERERPVLLWVDLRQSMFFATRGVFKSVVASKAAALLAWSTAAHRDRLGGLLFSEDAHHELQPSNGKTAVLRFIQQLARQAQWKNDTEPTAHDSTSNTLAKAFLRLRNVSRPGSLIFLLSDFRRLDEKSESHLSQISKHNDVVMIHISDPMEMRLPPKGTYRLSDGRRSVSIDTSDNSLRSKYEQQRLQHLEHLERLCTRHRIFLLNLSTQDDVVHKLQQGLGLAA